MAERVRIVISGCSGGGKSTLLAALGREGFMTVAEPGRAIVAAEQAMGGTALPWIDPIGFAYLCLERARADHRAAGPGITIFDRSAVDAVAALSRLGEPVEGLLDDLTYAPTVFLAPPWTEIYETDAERQHDLHDATAEYTHLAEFYPACGYQTLALPRASVEDRVAFVRAALSEVVA